MFIILAHINELPALQMPPSRAPAWRRGEEALQPRVRCAPCGAPGYSRARVEGDGSQPRKGLCCGGGGGNFFTDFVGVGEDSPSRVRAREALQTGTEVLAVACPLCAKMLTDALKAEQAEDRMEVLELAEIVRRAA